MLFKQALQDIETLFLFDMHSQTKLRELADAAEPGSQDWRLLRTTEVAIFFYNHSDALIGDQMRGIQNALEVVAQLKRSGADRLTIMIALRLEMDLLARSSALNLAAVNPKQQHTAMFTKLDQRALEVGEALLEHFPSLNPLPVEFHHLLCPLMPPYKQEVLAFYRSATQEARMTALVALFKTHRRHLVMLVGMLRAKRILTTYQFRVENLKQATQLFALDAQLLHTQAAKQVEDVVTLAYDLTLPDVISVGQLTQQIVHMRKHIKQLKEQQVPPDEMAENMLKMGILFFLNKESEASIETLVEVLKIGQTIPSSLKQQRKNQYDRFSDIPFMLGVSYLRIHGIDPTKMLEENEMDKTRKRNQQHTLKQATSSFLQAIALDPKYRPAYENLGVVYALQRNYPEQHALIEGMLQVFGGDINDHSARQFINLAVIAQKNHKELQVEAVQWALVSKLCKPTKSSKSAHLLQELRTLYTLRAHRESTEMYRQYVRNLKVRDPDFLSVMSDTQAHSAVLFYMAHGHCFFAAQKTQDTSARGEGMVDYGYLHRSIILNADAIYYDNSNINATRLAQTHKELLEAIWKRLSNGWQEAQLSMMRSATLYQEMLQVKMLSKSIGEHLKSVPAARAKPILEVSAEVQTKINHLIPTGQRLGIQRRAEDVVKLGG